MLKKDYEYLVKQYEKLDKTNINKSQDDVINEYLDLFFQIQLYYNSAEEEKDIITTNDLTFLFLPDFIKALKVFTSLSCCVDEYDTAVVISNIKIKIQEIIKKYIMYTEDGCFEEFTMENIKKQLNKDFTKEEINEMLELFDIKKSNALVLDFYSRNKMKLA